jgi:hypothetical protein
MAISNNSPNAPSTRMSNPSNEHHNVEKLGVLIEELVVEDEHPSAETSSRKWRTNDSKREEDVIAIGISGATSSGKTTL